MHLAAELKKLRQDVDFIMKKSTDAAAYPLDEIQNLRDEISKLRHANEVLQDEKAALVTAISALNASMISNSSTLPRNAANNQPATVTSSTRTETPSTKTAKASKTKNQNKQAKSITTASTDLMCQAPGRPPRALLFPRTPLVIKVQQHKLIQILAR